MMSGKICGGIADVGAVKHLVRDVLRCSCPEGVFDDVQIGVPRLFDGGLEGRVADVLVGRRLLVTIVRARRLARGVDHVRLLLEEGKRVRDEHGLNRFRLVLLGQVALARRAEIEAAASRAGERVHVHFVPGAELR